jgi:hypothetical protein
MRLGVMILQAGESFFLGLVSHAVCFVFAGGMRREGAATAPEDRSVGSGGTYWFSFIALVTLRTLPNENNHTLVLPRTLSPAVTSQTTTDLLAGNPICPLKWCQ